MFIWRKNYKVGLKQCDLGWIMQLYLLGFWTLVLIGIFSEVGCGVGLHKEVKSASITRSHETENNYCTYSLSVLGFGMNLALR